MLPTEDSIWAAEELARRFGTPKWQLTLSATDANRFAIRIARQITGRHRILVFSYCYHGTVDESFIVVGPDGRPVSRDGNVGPPVDPTETTSVVEFNDAEALERVLREEEIACVMTEPALTNIGIVLPSPVPRRAARADPGHRDPAPDRRDAPSARDRVATRRRPAWSPPPDRRQGDRGRGAGQANGGGRCRIALKAARCRLRGGLVGGTLAGNA
jgi:glutamate-1-semialdehyde 2,1-aminomutase